MNPLKGETPLVLADGTALTLVADHAALIKAAQVHTGRTKLPKLMADLQPLTDDKGNVVVDEDGAPVKDTFPAMCALFYGMLDAYHPDMTLRDATNILAGQGDRVAPAIEQAVELGFPDAKAELGNVKRPQGGKRSGASGAKQG